MGEGLRRFFGFRARAAKSAEPHREPAGRHEGSPRRVLAIDVETTGLDAEDRIVSFGGVMVEMDALGAAIVASRAGTAANMSLRVKHLICDPGRDSHPAARRVHGYSRRALRAQQPFCEVAEEVSAFIGEADIIVAHNAEFDVGFVDRELGLVNLPPISAPIYCTMLEWRRRRMPGSARLDNVAAHFGLARTGATHSALEDALLALMIFLRFSDIRAPISWEAAPVPPTNFREPPAEA